MKLATVHIVDDDRAFFEAVSVAGRGRFECMHSATVQDFRDSFAPESCAVLVLDVRLERGREGLQLLRDVRGLSPHQRIVVATAYPDAATRLEAISQGANEFVDKTVSTPADIATTIRHEIEKAELQRRILKLKETTDPALSGGSRSMERLREALDSIRIRKPRLVNIIGPAGSPVLGVARSLHDLVAPLDLFRPIPANRIESLPDYSGTRDRVVCLTGIEELDEPSGALLTDYLAQSTSSNTRVIACFEGHADDHPGLVGRLSRIPATTIEVPRLADRRSDLPEIVATWWRRFPWPTAEDAGPSILKTLVGHEWRGDVSQLLGLLDAARAHSRAVDGLTIDRALRAYLDPTMDYPGLVDYRVHLALSEMALLEQALEETPDVTQKVLAQQLKYADVTTLRRHVDKGLSFVDDAAARWPRLAALFPASLERRGRR